MKLSLFQLNINADNYWDTLIPFLTTHTFDVMHFQELTGKDTIVGNIHSKIDTFIELKEILKDKYNSELSIEQRFSSGPESYMANGIFYKKSLPLIEKKEYRLSSFNTFFPSVSTDYEKVGRTLQHLTLQIGDQSISFLNTHFAWGRDHIEKPFQTEQGEILIEYLTAVKPPFVLSGDFNLTPDQPLIKKLDTFARNLTAENHITNTLNPTNHRAKHLFPKGLAVDYIFTSRDIKTENFSVIDEGLSDHFGLSVEIEI
ncbi:MAG TPA: endonuclease/exonuclease/phosphatase family protein [Candidatus Saccharimonadales bacterium]|nr:endonuclease/exonuclease/phosphatase family protein [Candidatus Saccharimonadales bacterium]